MAMTDVEIYIRNAARLRGIDPDVAVNVAKSEGGVNSWTRQSDMRRPDGSREQSYGPFQLYMGGGMGNQFQRATGLHPSDPNAAKAGIDFALDQAKAGGWGPWYGAKKIGVTGMAGINGNPVNMTTGSETAAMSGVASLPTVAQGLGQQMAQASTVANSNVAKGDPFAGIFGELMKTSVRQAPVPQVGIINRPVDNRPIAQKVAETSQTPDAYIADIKRRYL